MKRLFVSLLLMSCPPAAVVTVSTAPAPRPVSEQDELAALLVSIPPDCASIEPLEPVTCPAVHPEPPGACIVERIDTRSKRVTDRLVYADNDLIRDDRLVSSHTRANTLLTWDSAHRLTETTVCITAGAGEPDWSPTWRPPMAVYDEGLTAQTRTQIAYAGADQTPRFAKIDSTAGEANSRIKRCYASDEAGHRARRVQTYRDQTPAALQVEVRKYTRDGSRLSAIDVRSIALKERGLSGQTKRRVDFVYDQAGRLTALGEGSMTTLQYDARGRLVAFGTVTFDWNDAGRLTGFHPGEPALDGRFEWDASGRIASATFLNGDGYRVTYSPTCPAGFSPPPVTPSVEGYLFYEGEDAL